MKKRGCRRFVMIAAAAFLILIVSTIAWLFWPQHPTVPAELLFPPQLYAAVRLKDFSKAYEEHWSSRGEDDSDQAMQHLLEFLGVWPDWVETYGEQGAKDRIKDYRRAIFQMVGKETWIVYGKFVEDDPEHTIRPSLAFVTAANSRIKGKLGAFASVLLSKRNFETNASTRGVTFYSYSDDSGSPVLTWIVDHGWI